MSRENLEQTEQARKYRQAVEQYLAPAQLGVLGSFAREVPWDGDWVALIREVQWVVRTLQRRRAHRLPVTFLLAVTSDKVHFLKYRTRRSEVEIRGEFLVLDRDAVRFEVWERGVLLNVDERGHTTPIDIARGSLENPETGEVVAALSK